MKNISFFSFSLSFLINHQSFNTILHKGSVQNGLNLHPDNEHIIYPLGSSVIVRHIVTRTQTFLNGHDNLISALTVSSKGNYIASGQQTYGGFQVNYKNEEKKSCFEFAFFSNNIKLFSYSLKKKKGRPCYMEL